MAEQGISLPSGFGGLVNYKEEYNSKLALKPQHVIILIVAVIALRISLKYIFGSI